MAKTTYVYFEGIWAHDNTILIFRTTGDDFVSTLGVNDFKDGIVTLKPFNVIDANGVKKLATTIAGCFNDDSNFGAKVLRAYDCDKNVAFSGIKFEFMGVTLTITKENANAEMIYQEWEAGIKTLQKEREAMCAWLKTPEGQKYLAQPIAESTHEKAVNARKKAIEEKLIHIDETIELEFKDEESKKFWEKLVEANSKGFYSISYVRYTRRWAKCMQKLISEGKTVAEIAKKTSDYCDAVEGVTGFMHGCAVNALSHYWKYGDELLKWHNAQKNMAIMGDDIVNPTD